MRSKVNWGFNIPLSGGHIYGVSFINDIGHSFIGDELFTHCTLNSEWTLMVGLCNSPYMWLIFWSFIKACVLWDIKYEGDHDPLPVSLSDGQHRTKCYSGNEQMWLMKWYLVIRGCRHGIKLILIMTWNMCHKCGLCMKGTSDTLWTKSSIFAALTDIIRSPLYDNTMHCVHSCFGIH